MAVKTFEDLFIDELKDVYDAEKRIVRALPKLVKNANSEELSDALEAHLGQTEKHVERLDRIFKELGKSPGRKSCPAMMGLLAEADELLEESDDPTVRDAAIIAAAQKVEHYEMATYGTLREWAKLLGHSNVAKTLQETLDEEGKADKTLTKLSQGLNVFAAHAEVRR